MDLSRFGPSVNPLAAALAGGGAPAGGPLSPQLQASLPGGTPGGLPGLPPGVMPPISPTPGQGTPNVGLPGGPNITGINSGPGPLPSVPLGAPQPATLPTPSLPSTPGAPMPSGLNTSPPNPFNQYMSGPGNGQTPAPFVNEGGISQVTSGVPQLPSSMTDNGVPQIPSTGATGAPLTLTPGAKFGFGSA